MRSQVIDALEAQETKETGNEEGQHKNHCGRAIAAQPSASEVPGADSFSESWKSNLTLLKSVWFSSSVIYG
jgi:hypothetical protein